ncbi:E3 ubiquitin-protein ligase HOS1-like [Carya illinoinensis]|uniref:RING-type domain-containing protein n=1 Tax=Carya illinoinensis TaxID=32201 RepID=A0A8T1P008_CARIL|nr:E3 ubiquitin-protein ligase HOS1-like [Carya illinoinensis]KAG6636025.1 hypothetical protein CIPAW_11G082400 [Carya illinoinensis]
MDRRFNGPTAPSSSTAAAATRLSSPPPRPNCNSRAVQEALERLASIDLFELCYEAKVEHCRATRDLRICGRYVHNVLIACGHASLCEECSQRCDLCPICRIPLPKIGNRLRLRLYYECIQAGLISKRSDERFQEIEDGDKQLTADVLRLYSLFDVALENNLVSLVCHYVTDVCMDESAVSSDPVIAFLLDEVVVKDWCKRTFRNIATELQGIYNLEVEEMKSRLSFLLNCSVQLTGICNVLEVLESSFKGSLSAQLHDLCHLQENILKTKQHMEIMMWCIRHQFLENVRSRYANFMSWRSCVSERKSAAIKRSWPDAVNFSAESTRQDGSLFIEDALVNLDIEQGDSEETAEKLEAASLVKSGVLSILRSKIEGLAGCYPFENLRAAVDILFLCGSSDLVVAKQAILLYFLFDRHWKMPDEMWRHIVEDFATSFSITRHSLLESLIFYLLDDHTDEALQEACRFLPEISGPTTHPKIARVLLERNNPDTALMVLRWSGCDGGLQMVSLSEAITSVRVRVECGLLTEAFTHQRMLCTKVREKKLKHGPSGNDSDNFKSEFRNWVEWVDILVTEICCLCIRRNLVDRMIELPWNSDEEKHIHKCLLEFSIEDPSTTTGSLLVVFYLQRYRYTEAFQVDFKLKTVEQDFISKSSVGKEVLSRIRSASHWRASLIDKCMELLPDVQRQQVKSGQLPEIAASSVENIEMPAKSDFTMVQEPISTSLLIPSSTSSLGLGMDHLTPFSRSSVFENQTRLPGSINVHHSEVIKYGSQSILYGRGLRPRSSINKDFNLNDSTPETRRVSLMNASLSREINRATFGNLQDSSPEMEQNGFINQLHDASPLYSYRLSSNPIGTPSSNQGLFKDSGGLNSSFTGKRIQSDRDYRLWNGASSDDQMEISWSHGGRGSAAQDNGMNCGLRWRSDETSDEEEEQGPEGSMGMAYQTTPTRIRRSRLAKR